MVYKLAKKPENLEALLKEYCDTRDITAEEQTDKGISLYC